eukprot:jgi/Hompol1/6753/HPOL_002336-RA
MSTPAITAPADCAIVQKAVPAINFTANCCDVGNNIDCAGGRVTQLNLNNLNLGGQIPDALGTLTGLVSLFLNGNGFTGTIPASYGSLVTLQDLWLGQNKLTGPIPATFGNLRVLQSLHLEGNQITGVVPPSLGKLANLSFVDLDGNTGMTGQWPDGFALISVCTALNTSICFPNNHPGKVCTGMQLSAVAFVVLVVAIYIAKAHSRKRFEQQFGVVSEPQRDRAMNSRLSNRASSTPVIAVSPASIDGQRHENVEYGGAPVTATSATATTPFISSNQDASEVNSNSQLAPPRSFRPAPPRTPSVEEMARRDQARISSYSNHYT